MSNKSYLRNIVIEEYNKQNKKLFLEDVIQEEYQKIIQEQGVYNYDGKLDPDEEAKLTPGKVGGFNSNMCKADWNEKDREYLKKFIGMNQLLSKESCTQDSCYSDIFNIRYWKQSQCVIAITLAQDFTKIFNSSGVSTAGKFLRGQVFNMFGNGTAETYLNIGGLRNKKMVFNWNRADDPKDGIELYEGEQYIGNIHPRGSYIFVPLTRPEASWGPIDYLQAIGDWAGLIPVYGDAIDVVNGIGYAARGKWFDSILSFIAVIPVAGSVFKLGLKNSVKVARVNMKLVNSLTKRILMGQASATKQFWKLMWKSGALKSAAALEGKTVDQLFTAALANLDTAEAIARKGVKSANAGNYEEYIQDYAQALVDFFKNSKLSIKELQTIARAGGKQVIKWGKSPAFKAATTKSKVIDSILSSSVFRVSRVLVMLATFPLSLIPLLLKRVFKFPDSKLAELAAGYKEVVSQRIKDTPQYMSAIMRAMPEDKLFRILGGPSSSRVRNLQNLLRKPLENLGYNANQIRTVFQNPQTLHNALSNPELFKSPAFRQAINKYSDKILDIASKGDNLSYNLFFNNKAWQAQQLFKRSTDFSLLLQNGKFKAAFSELSGIYLKWKNLALNSKNADIYWNQFSDLLDRTNLNSKSAQENPDSILLALLMSSIDIGTGEKWGTTSAKWRTNLLSADSTIVHGSAAIQNWITKIKLQDAGPVKSLFTKVLDLIPVVTVSDPNTVGTPFGNFEIDYQQLTIASGTNDPTRQKNWVEKTWEEADDDIKAPFEAQYKELLRSIDVLIKQKEDELRRATAGFDDAMNVRRDNTNINR